MTLPFSRRQVLRLSLGTGGWAGVQAVVPQFVMSSHRPRPQAAAPLRVGISDRRRPLSFVDETGIRVGLEITLARQLATVLRGSDPDLAPDPLVEFVPLANSERLDAVTSGQVDLAIAGITATDVRRRLVTFSLPYYLDGTTFITQNPEVRSLADIARQDIGILRGSSAIATVRYRLPQADLIGLDSYAAALEFLTTQPQAVFAGDASVLAGWAQVDPRYRVGPSLLSVEPLAIAMPKGLQHTELHLQVNAAIEQWTDSGWLMTQLREWQLP